MKDIDQIKREQAKTEAEAVQADDRLSGLGRTENPVSTAQSSKEVGGPKGLEPTRYGEGEAKGRCYDF